jgi:hypothetical protein
MRLLLLLCMVLLSSCAVPRIFASAPEPEYAPTIIRLDTMGQLTQLSTGKIKFNGPVTIQHGTGNVATTTETDNTGRAASSGANGGHSSDVSKGMPLGVLLVLFVMAMVAGVLAYRKWWPGARAAVLLLLLMPLASQAEETPNPRRYSYREARRVERRYNRVVRYHRRQNRQDARDLHRDRKLQAKRLKKDHP